MRGLGRNIRFQIRTVHKFLGGMVPAFLVYVVIFSVLSGPKEALPSVLFYGMIMLEICILLGGVVMGNNSLSLAVSLGSARKPASIAVIIAHQILIAEAAVLVFVCTLLFADQLYMQLIKACPWALLGVALLLTGMSIWMNVEAIRSDTKASSWKFFVLLFLSILIILGVILCMAVFDTEQISRANHPIVALAGLLADVAATAFYYQVIQKADLKIA